MKEVYFKKVEIKLEEDLPKKFGGYYICTFEDTYGYWTYSNDFDKKLWLELVDWYLLPADHLTDEVIEKYFTSHHYDTKNGQHYRMNKDRAFGAKWYRNKLIK